MCPKTHSKNWEGWYTNPVSAQPCTTATALLGKPGSVPAGSLG